GDNSVLLAQYGFHVTATDIAQPAVDAAHDKAETLGAAHRIDFIRHDILESPPVTPGTVGFAFDRGVFHVVTDDERPRFAQHIADALAPHGWWLSLCGNADDPAEGGPPRLTAAHITAVLEPRFEVHRLVRSHFRRVQESPASSYLCWAVLLRKRA
ncbi:MAG: class I SAM-dependent methyltransferase, partial [Phycisphaeraceae bacterium]